MGNLIAREWSPLLKQNDQHVIARVKFLFACRNLHQNKIKHINDIQLLMQCCATTLIANLPDTSAAYRVKTASTVAFASSVSAHMTAHKPIDYVLIKHHIAQTTTSFSNFESTSYYNRNGNSTIQRKNKSK